MTARAASALLRTPSFEKIIRTPVGVFEGFDRTKILAHHDPRLTEGCDRSRNVFVLRRQNARTCLKELDP
jgi:hypothetical protein